MAAFEAGHPNRRPQSGALALEGAEHQTEAISTSPSAGGWQPLFTTTPYRAWSGGIHRRFPRDEVSKLPHDALCNVHMPEPRWYPVAVNGRRIGGLIRAAKYGGTEATRAPRAAFLAGFEARADPESVLDPAERHKRARLLLRAHMAKLALESAKVRAKRKKAAKEPGDEAA